MSSYTLTSEEKALLKAFDEDKLSSVANVTAQKKKYAEIVRNSVKKTKTISIRIAEKDLQKMKSKALQKGVPYQTLLTGLLHEYANK